MDIWINTDSDEVVDLYKDGGYDLNFYLRPDNVRGHDVSMNKVLADWIESREPYDFYLQTHITNPFLSSYKIDDAVEMFTGASQHAISIMGVTTHQCRTWYKGAPVNFKHGAVIPTQDLTPVFEDNSCIYIFNHNIFYHYGRVSNPPIMIDIPWPENIDIDTIEEWELAKLVAENYETL